MKTYDQIASELFERRAEREKRIKRNIRTAGLILVPCVIAAAAILVLISANKKPNGPVDVYNSPEPTTQSPIITEAPVTEPPETEPPTTYSPVTEPPETCLPRIFAYVSEHTEYTAAVQTLLSGGKAEGTFTLNGGGVFFGFEGDRLVAYREARWNDDAWLESLELYQPIADYPAELGVRAKESIAAFNGTIAAESVQLFGFIGENYIIFTNDPYHGGQDHAIFRTDDGENWYEFGAAKDHRLQITGGLIMNESEGYLCCVDRSLMMFDSYTPRQLTVLHTTDGGETWSDIGLCIPDECEDSIAPPSAALSPAFMGDHGVMPVAYCIYNSATDEVEPHTARFESFDGGKTWTFFPDLSDV